MCVLQGGGAGTVHCFEKMTVEDGFDGRFPVGMRVLAVDDDPTSLLVLGSLLRQCNYKGIGFFNVQNVFFFLSEFIVMVFNSGLFLQMNGLFLL